MRKIIKRNFQIFLTWLVYIVFRKPMSKEAIEFVEEHYRSTEREKRIISRIKKLNLG